MKRIPYISAAELFPERVDTGGNVVLNLLTTFSHFREALLHRHPIRLGNNQVSLLLRSPQADVHEAALHRHHSRSAESEQAPLCFNGLYTPFGSPVIGGQKRLLVMFAFSHFEKILNGFQENLPRIFVVSKKKCIFAVLNNK